MEKNIKSTILFFSLFLVCNAFFYHKPRPKCGGKDFYPSFQLCCRGVRVPKSGNILACCGNFVYHRIAQMCCNGKAAYKRGKFPACCVYKSYDAAVSKCERGRIVPI